MQSAVLANRDSIIDRIATGERLIDIAKSLGLKTHAAISMRLADDPEYRIARKVGVQATMEKREIEMESADDSVTVARVRELLGHARWRAEREFPEEWGKTVAVTDSRTDLGERLRRAKERVIEAEPNVALPHSVNNDSCPTDKKD